jgi:GNAT superfamily N-acetyltransferase
MITIRRAKQEDAAAIVDFQQKMAWETERLSLVHETVTAGVNQIFKDPSRGQYWVAESNEDVIASLLITYEWSDWRNASVWWFQSVYVMPAHRRTGIFRSMYSHIKNESDKNRVAGLRLYVEINNSRARKTYESLGMKSEHYTMYEWMKE